MPTPFADRYREAMRHAGGACPIESGVHGRLPGDRSRNCGCWPQENAPVIELSRRPQPQPPPAKRKAA